MNNENASLDNRQEQEECTTLSSVDNDNASLDNRRKPEEHTTLTNTQNENASLDNRQEIKKRKSCISPYNVFFSDYLQQQQNVCRNNFGQMSKNASVAWSNMQETEKQVFLKTSQEKTTLLQELPDVKSNGEYFQCCKCGKKLNRRTSLKIHESECGKTFSCSMCNKEFSSASHLRRHKKCVHDKMKLHQCKECDTKFFTQTDLHRHATSHTKLAQFACHICNNTFMYKTNLNRHIKKVHP